MCKICVIFEAMDLHIHSPIRLHDVVLNQISTGTTLPFYIRNNTVFMYVGLNDCMYVYLFV
jgi:hypothetical protein